MSKPAAMGNAALHRWARRLHVWVGAWGAIAAMLFGLSGFLQNHRAILKLPQGSSTEVAISVLPVPKEARASQEALRTWLRESQKTPFDVRPAGRTGGGGRGPMPGAGDAPAADSPAEYPRHAMAAFAGDPPAARGAEGRASPSRWLVSGGGARTTYQAEYHSGDPTLILTTSVQSPLAVLIRLHKGVGGGVAWTLLSDSFALSMVVLGISGLVMWSRGRTARQMAFSILGAAAVVLLLVAGSAVI